MMSLYKQLFYFFKSVEEQILKSNELFNILNTSVVFFTQNQIRNSFVQLLKKNLSLSSFKKNFKLKNIDFNRARLSAQAKDFLNEHVLISVNLIKLHRDEQIQATLRRFSGWISSIPSMGEGKPSQSIKSLSRDLLKPLHSLNFENRRVLIDQGHKFTSAVNNAIAKDQGAIAVKWVSHWKEEGYNYRPDHKKPDGHIYLIRDNSFVKNGFIKKMNIQYIDDIDGFGQLPFCRCYGIYLFNLRDLPSDMLTEKGKKYING